MTEIDSNLLDVLVHGYFLLALGYNVASQALLDVSGRQLAPTDPAFGLVFVALTYLLFLLKSHISTYPLLVLSAVLLASILRFGIISHAMNSSEAYYSPASRFAAILINVYGCIVLFPALLWEPLFHLTGPGD